MSQELKLNYSLSYKMAKFDKAIAFQIIDISDCVIPYLVYRNKLENNIYFDYTKGNFYNERNKSLYINGGKGVFIIPFDSNGSRDIGYDNIQKMFNELKDYISKNNRFFEYNIVNEGNNIYRLHIESQSYDLRKVDGIGDYNLYESSNGFTIKSSMYPEIKISDKIIYIKGRNDESNSVRFVVRNEGNLVEIILALEEFKKYLNDIK